MPPRAMMYTWLITVVLGGHLQAQDAQQRDSVSHAGQDHHMHQAQSGDSGFAACSSAAGR